MNEKPVKGPIGADHAGAIVVTTPCDTATLLVSSSVQARRTASLHSQGCADPRLIGICPHDTLVNNVTKFNEVSSMIWVITCDR